MHWPGSPFGFDQRHITVYRAGLSRSTMIGGVSVVCLGCVQPYQTPGIDLTPLGKYTGGRAVRSHRACRTTLVMASSAELFANSRLLS